jgi:hypothetical protein
MTEPTTEYWNTLAEIKELESLLAAIPNRNVIDRMSIEARIKSVKDDLKRLSRAKSNVERQRRFAEAQRALGRRGRKIWATDAEIARIKIFLAELRKDEDGSDCR